MELSTIIKGVVANKLKRIAKLKYCAHYELQRANILQAQEELNDCRVIGTVFDGNFTTVMIGNHKGTFIGVAKRNPVDAYNAKRGECLAASRAVKSAINLNT
jgi:hypothetical protein